MKIYFISSNKYKISEVKEILEDEGVEIEGHELKINEIQSPIMEDIAIDKAKKAYKKIGRPVMVEQTGLYIPEFGNLPGGLTQVFWDSLQADKFCEFFAKKSPNVTAKTIIAFCDGMKIHTFSGEIEGSIVEEPRGDRAFQWDCVFQPTGYDKTFAELGAVKNQISMRKKALMEFKKYLEDKDNV